MSYIQIQSTSKKSIGHFDFEIKKRWMLVEYGTFATDPSDNNLSEWTYSAIRDVAIEVEEDYLTKYAGLGRAMVSLALHWGEKNGRSGMIITDARSARYWEKLGFYPNGENMILTFANRPIPPIKIELRQGGKR
ncbi:MAG: hypothetical protein ABH823_01730 [bacterium]